MNLWQKLKADYALLFGKTWPVWVGGVVIGIVNVVMFASGDPWSTLDGVLNWGDNLGISNDSALPVLLRKGSLLNFGLLFGAFLSALLSKQFSVRVGPVSELVKGLIGGVLIGVGAVLVRGCNIGGFFSGSSSMGLHGLTMALGLTIGAFIGARFLVWEMMRDTGTPAKRSEPRSSPLPALVTNINNQPLLGAGVALVVTAWAFYYYQGDQRALLIWPLFGVILGIASQRSRLCFVHAFREPFITGDASHTKAMLLGLVISMVGISAVKADVFNDRTLDFVRATFWQGSLVGGIIFGFGMVIAGGCGGGMMWRVGEGHIKLWMALLGYIVSASLMDDWLMDSGMIDKLGSQAFLPDMVGWGWALALMGVVIFLWYLVVQWNEYSHRLAAI